MGYSKPAARAYRMQAKDAPDMPNPLTGPARRLRRLLALIPPNWCLAILVALHGYAFMHPIP